MQIPVLGLRNWPVHAIYEKMSGVWSFSYTTTDLERSSGLRSCDHWSETKFRLTTKRLMLVWAWVFVCIVPLCLTPPISMKNLMTMMIRVKKTTKNSLPSFLFDQ